MQKELAYIEQEQDRFRTNFYRDNFRRGVLALMLLVMINIALVIVSFHLYITRPHDPQKFYSTNMQVGRIRTLYPLSAPLPRNLVLDNYKYVVSTVFNVNFVNYNEVFKNIKGYFNTSGWQAFNQSMSEVLSQIKNNNLFVKATLGKPVILNPQGTLIRGIRTYNARIALRLNYSSNTPSVNVKPEIYIVTATISKMLDLDKPEKIVISNFSVNKYAQPS